MTTMVDELDFERATRRIARFLAWVAVAGTAVSGAAGGWKWAAGFLGALGGGRAISSFRLALRYFLLGVCGYVIVRFSSIPAAAMVAGMFVLIAAIFIEIFFELVYARKRTLDHQDL